MSKLTTAGALTGQTEYEVSSSVMGGVIIAKLINAAGLAFLAITVEATVHNPDGSVKKRIADAGTSLLGLAELKALNKDNVIRTKRVLTNGVAFTDPATSKLTEIELAFDIAELGQGIKLAANDTVRVKFSGLQVGDAMDVYHEETKNGGVAHKKYDVLTTDTTPNRKFHMDSEIKAIAIKKGNNFKGVVIRYKDSSQEIPLLPEEIESQSREEKGFVYNEKVITVDAATVTNMEENNQGYYTLPINNVEWVQVNTDQTSCEVIIERTVGANKTHTFKPTHK